MLRKIIIVVFAVLTVWNVGAQDMRPIFAIDGKPVFVSEFKRECRDYFELCSDTAGLYSLMNNYADYRLCVHDARIKKLDTTTWFANATDYYKKRILLEYVVSNAKTQSQIKKLIAHSMYQYKVKYIRVDIFANSRGDTLAAYGRACRIKDRITSGRKFETVAMQLSDHPSTKINSGLLGWVSPIDFNAGEEVEDYVFAHCMDGKDIISRPIRCGNSYYIVCAEGRRPAVDRVDISPIIIRKQNRWKYNDSIRSLFFKIKEDLDGGISFDVLQKQYSDIKFNENLSLDAAYAKYTTQISSVEGVGKYSDVIESPDFYCIVRINAETPLVVDSYYQKKLQQKIQNNEIFRKCYEEFLDSVRTAAGYKQLSGFGAICKLMPDSSIFEAKWQPGDLDFLSDDLFVYDGKKYTQADFARYIYNTQHSTGYAKVSDYVAQRFNDYISEITLRTAGDKLVKNNEKCRQDYNYYVNTLCYSVLKNNLAFARKAADTNTVLNYYQKTGLHLKSNHVLAIQFYDYDVKNRKKIEKVTSQIKSGNNSAIGVLATKSSEGIYSIGDNKLADKIIEGYDAGKYSGEKNVIFFDDIHTMAVVKVEKPQQELSTKEIFGVMSPRYAEELRSEYIKKLRSQYNLKIMPEASNVLEESF